MAIIFIIATCLFIFRPGNSTPQTGEFPDGNVAVVKIDGREIRRYPLNHDVTDTIKTDNGINTIEIRNGSLRVTEADCPDKLCVYQKAISRPGETVVCLPHRLVIEVIGPEKEHSGLDSISN